MREIKAPQEYAAEDRLFLAGSIEMGKAEMWQDVVVKALEDKNVLILNPRRDDWDSSWEQKVENPQFFDQVQWELDSMKDADIVAMYFSPGTQSPITLLELGLMAPSRKLLVCCPEGFWRKGNVDVVCLNYDIEQVNSLDELIEALRWKLQ